MASSLVVEDPKAQKISARPMDQMELQRLWKPRHSSPILRDVGFYWLVYYNYNYAMAIKR